MSLSRIDLLRDAGLPFPLPIAPPLYGGTIAELPPRVFLRSRVGVRPARVVDAAEYKRLLADGELANVKAVEYVPSIAGITTIGWGGAVFVELALGHLSGLLSHGYVCVRYLIDPLATAPRYSEYLRQYKRVDPETLSVGDLQSDGGREVDFSSLCWGVAARVSEAFGDRYLTEVMIRPDQSPIWVDAKPYPWSIDLPSLFEPARKRIYGEADSARAWPSDSWEPATLPDSLKGFSLAVDDHAITSHLVTYALERGLTALYNRSETIESHTELPHPHQLTE